MQQPSERSPIFTEREMMVFSLLRQGRSLDQIARELFISTNTVKNHMRNVAEKLRAWADLEPD